MENIKEKKCKVVFIGDKSVGKTSIINQYINKTFLFNCKPTLSASFYRKSLIIKGININFDIWDTAGEESYRSLTKIFLKNAKICVFVYDMTNVLSFINIKEMWYKYVLEHIDKDDIIFVIVGNKNDLIDKQEVDTQNAILYAKEINAIFDEINALDYNCVNNLIEKIAEKYVDSIRNKSSDTTENSMLISEISIGKSSNSLSYKNQHKSCCKN